LAGLLLQIPAISLHTVWYRDAQKLIRERRYMPFRRFRIYQTIMIIALSFARVRRVKIAWF
jgi:hypothetical protein